MDWSEMVNGGLVVESGVVSSFVGGWSAPVPDTPPAYDPDYPDRNLVSRTLYDNQGRPIVTIRNLWNPDGGALTQSEIEAGYPDRNLVSVTHYNASGQVDWTVENFVGDLSALGTPPAFSASTPDQNLLTVYSYDASSRRTDTTIKRGSETRVSHTSFDALGRTSATIANTIDGAPVAPDVNVTTSYIYEALGRITETTDPAGRVRRSVSEQLDAVLGRTSVSITDPFGLALTSTSVSNAAGQTSRSIDASGRIAETTFDAQGRSVETTIDPDNLALTSSSAYDLLGRAITSTDAEDIVTRYQYDNLGRLRVVFENYVSGLSDSSWPACQYDIDSINVCTRYNYDQAGNLTSTVLGNGSGTTYEYDARGQMKLETVDPGAKNIATAYTYDATGSQVTLTRDPAGTPQLTTTFHDRLGRTTGIDYVGTASDVVYSYDAWGNRATMLDAGGTWQYAYDAMNHLTSVTNPQSIEVAYEYDPTGNRTDLDLTGMSVDYTFDNAGRLDTVSNPFGTGVVDYTYDDADMTGATLPNGTSTANTYDTAGRLEQILNAAGAEALSSFLYTLDDRGNRTDAVETLTTPSGMLMGASMPTETPQPTPTLDLTVTPTETQAPTATEAPTVTPTPTEAATVEPLNLTVEPLDATVEPLDLTVEPLDATVEPLGATVTPAETPMETPTLAPSETPTPEVTPTATEPPMPTETETPLTLMTIESGDHNWHYGYDNLSRVTLACSDGWDDVAETCAGNEFIYEYDGAGNLTRFDKWNATTSTVDTVRYVINGANQIACIDTDGSKTCNGSETLWEYDVYGNLKNDGTTTYTYDTANRVSSITAAGVTTSYTYNGDGDRIEQKVGEVTTTYILDTATPLTMVLSETNDITHVTTRYWHGLDTLAQSDGTTTQYFAYDGLGSVRQLVDTSGSVGLAQTFDPYGNGYAKAGSAASSLGFTGEQTDSNGFVFLRARYYQPGMGRFIQMDPSRLEKNAYQYAAGNPVMFIDPSGLKICTSSMSATGCAEEIIKYYRRAASDLTALAQLFVNDELSQYAEAGSSTQDRLEFIIGITRQSENPPGNMMNFRIDFGETGLRWEFQDGWLYDQNGWSWTKHSVEPSAISPGYPGLKTNQIGHFLTAVNIAYHLVFVPETNFTMGAFGFNLSVSANVGIASVIGHELQADDNGTLEDAVSQTALGLVNVDLRYKFMDAVVDDITNRDTQRDDKLRDIFDIYGIPRSQNPQFWQQGNSINDLRLTVKGFSFAASIQYGGSGFSRRDAANWLDRELGTYKLPHPMSDIWSLQSVCP